MSQFLDLITRAEVDRGKPKRASLVSPRSLHSTKALESSAPPGSELDLSPANAEFVSIDELASRLWRRRFSVLGFGLAGITAALLLTALSKPVYRARTAIRLDAPADPYAAVNGRSTSIDGEPGLVTDTYVQNEMKLLQSDSLAERVAEKLDQQAPQPHNESLASSPLKKLFSRLMGKPQSLSPQEQRIQAIHDAATVRSSLKSQVLEISFDSTDPVRAALGANTIVSEYIAMNHEAQYKEAQDTTEWLSTQLSDLKAKQDRENQDLKAFASSAGLIYSANQSALSEQRVSEIQGELSKAEADRAATQARYEAAASSNPDSLPQGQDDTLLREYEANLVAAERDLAHLRNIYTQENYKVADAEARVAQIKTSILHERLNIVQRMREQFAAAARLQRSMQGTYAKQTQQLQSQSAAVFHYNELKHELDTTQQLYDALLQKIKEAQIASSLETTNVRMIDTAHPPSRPYSPNRPLNAVLGFGFGLLTGVLTVLFRDRGIVPNRLVRDRVPLTLREIAEIPDSPKPHFPGFGTRALPNRGGSRAALALASWQNDLPIAESFNSAVATILFSSTSDRHQKTLMVSSAEPQEGKTTVISNIAIMLAESYGRVLLVDGDLRQPMLHRIFDTSNDLGLTTLLTTDLELTELEVDQFTRPTKVPRLSLMPSGPGVPSVAPLLHSPKLAQLFTQAREDFDCVLIDSPPMSLFSDARVFGRLVDSVILVIDAGRRHRQAVSAAYHQLLQDGTPVLGAIRNRSDRGRFQRSYDYYESYRTA